MLTEPLDFYYGDYESAPPDIGLAAINNAPLEAQHQLQGARTDLNRGTDLRSILLQRFRAGFTGA